MWGQMVAQAGANISLTVLSSAPLGTQAQELTGDPAFNLNLTALPTTSSQRFAACAWWKQALSQRCACAGWKEALWHG